MRSVTVERNSRRASRNQPIRPSARGKRELPEVQPGTVRIVKEPGAIAKLGAGVAPAFKRPMFTLCGIVLVLVLIAALFASGIIGRGLRAIGHGLDAVTADAGFGISEIHITGNHRTPYRQILEVLGMQPGQSIFAADLWSAQRRMASLEWIASVEIHRRYPDAIFVTLVEKETLCAMAISG